MVPEIGSLPATICTDKMLKRESNGKRSRKGVGEREGGKGKAHSSSCVTVSKSLDTSVVYLSLSNKNNICF